MNARSIRTAMRQAFSALTTHERTDVLTNILVTNEVDSPLSDVRADALREALAIRQRWDVKAAYLDGKRDAAAILMTERSGQLWGQPFTLTIDWPAGEPDSRLWDATRSIADEARARP